MRKSTLVLAFALVMALALYPIAVKAQMGPGMMGSWGGYGGWYCPYCGRPMGPGMMGPGYGMGPGMMGPSHGMWGPHHGMGPGMMGPGYGYGPQYPPRYPQPQKAMDEKDARALVEDYLQFTRNPNLKLGKIEDKGYAFEAEILTKDGSLADRILVDKNTGWMRSVY